MGEVDKKKVETYYMEDQAYLSDCDLKGLLRLLVRDMARDRPENVYEYMRTWAVEKQKNAVKVQSPVL